MVIALCRADVTEDTIERVLGKVAKTAVTKAITSLEDVLPLIGHDVKKVLTKEAGRVLDQATSDLTSILQRPHILSEGKLIKTFVNSLKNEIPKRIEDKLISIYEAAKSTGLSSQKKRAPMSCHSDLDRSLRIFDFVNSLDFKNLPDTEQIFVFEILAAGEKCKLHDFLEPETSERLFILLDDMPMKYVHHFLQYLSQGLKSEGVNVPVK
ncbi:uncharacterized protein LOC121367317 [Gigantopelta aegis]|uniref:uncharacterized protein LOC121367317 n=1 Tax=Gigantopelta aegis TaxID=1735272 RepID=UPI001B887782|nr:uncharacterized protein LOC121367317 [Gigantopelta aegis]